MSSMQEYRILLIRGKLKASHLSQQEFVGVDDKYQEQAVHINCAFELLHHFCNFTRKLQSIYLIHFTESQNCRGWKGPLEIIQSTLLLKHIPYSRYIRKHSDESQMSPQETPPPLWAASSRILSHSKLFLTFVWISLCSALPCACIGRSHSEISSSSNLRPTAFKWLSVM